MKETADNMYILKKMHEIYLNKNGFVNIDGKLLDSAEVLRNMGGSLYKDSLEGFIEKLEESQYVAVIDTMKRQVGA